jgi:hypothetical protein
MSAKSFDVKTGVLRVAGIKMSGFGDNKITISRDEDVHSKLVGAEGDWIASKSYKTQGTVSFDLLPGTEYDLLMDNLVNFPTFFPVTYTDTASLKALVTFGKVMTQPDIANGESPEPRTWVLMVDNVDMSVNGQVGKLYSQAASYVAPSVG